MDQGLCLGFDLACRDELDELKAIKAQRIVEQVADRGLLDLAAGVHDDDTVRRLGHDAEIVGDQDHRRAELALQTATAVRDRVVSAYQDVMRMPI